jgi:hypothetical protein
MAWKLCTSGAAIAKAGANVNATIAASSATLAEWSDESEASLQTITRKDWITDADYTANFSGALADAASDMVAMKIINYDMSGYTSRMEAQTMLDVIRDNLMRTLDVLKDDKNKEVML